MKKIIIYTLLLCSLLAFNSCNNGNKNLNQNVKNEISRLKKEAKENGFNSIKDYIMYLKQSI